MDIVAGGVFADPGHPDVRQFAGDGPPAARYEGELSSLCETFAPADRQGISIREHHAKGEDMISGRPVLKGACPGGIA